MGLFEDKVSEYDQKYAVAKALSDDPFGNKRIAALKNMNFETERRVVKLNWNIYTTDAAGELVEVKGLLNPYPFEHATHDGIRVDPATGERVRDIGETETEEDYIANVITPSVGQYSFIVATVKSGQAKFFEMINVYLQKAIDKNEV